MFWKRRKRDDFSSELESHIALEADRFEAEGLSASEAYSKARQSFGNVTRSEEGFYEANRLVWLDNLKRDTSYAFRQLVKNKSFTVIVTATLSVGIAATASIFTLVNTTLLKALPYREGNRVISIKDTRLKGQSTGGLTGVPRFFDLQARNQSLAGLGFYFFDSPTLVAGPSQPLPLEGASVNGEFWETIGLQPLLGRTFTKSDDQPHAPAVAVIGYSLWQQAFGGDRNIVNRQVQLDGKTTTIIGVLAPHLQYPSKIDIWRPAQFDPTEWRYRGNGTRFVNVIARLKENVSFDAARQDLQRIGSQLQREYPATDGDWQFSSESLRDYLYGASKPALLVLLAASGVLLSVACINVANLLLSRATTRSREMALRRALGASRGRILAQLFTENTLLALLGGTVGLLAAFALVHGLANHIPGRLGATGVSLDWRIVTFTFILSVGTGIFFGLAPALESSHSDLNMNLKRGGIRIGGAAGGGMRNAFISIQVALSLVLLVGASLLAESLWNLINSALGFQADHVLTFEIGLPWNHNSAAIRRFFDELQQRIESIPGVTAAGQITALPTVDWHLRSDFDIDWRPRTAHNDAVNVEDRHISGHYLEAMRIPLIAGRNLTDRDVTDEDAKTGVVLVNRQFARYYYPGGNVIGRHLINQMATFEIVGVAGDVRGTAGSLAKPVGPEVYFPLDIHNKRTFVVRSALPPEQLIQVVRAQVHRMDPAQAVRQVATLNDRLTESVVQPRFNMGLLSSFAVAALLLACVGIYGVVSYSVTQKSVEIGIRMALGATRRQISVLFVRRALIAATAGLVMGGLIALLLTRLIRSQLYGVQPNHPLTYLLAALFLLFPVLLASAWPALKAGGMNPVETLRRD